MYNLSTIELWNVAAFEFLRAATDTPHLLAKLGALLTELPVYLAVALILVDLCRRRDGATATVLIVACVAARLMEALANLYIYHARPFAVGFGPALISHAANNSMPSSHVTFVWTIAMVTAFGGRWPLAGTLILLGAVLAWARIYVGIHWPLDMVGAALVAVVCACLLYTSDAADE